MLEVLLQGGANPSQPNKDVTRWGSTHACMPAVNAASLYYLGSVPNSTGSAAKVCQIMVTCFLTIDYCQVCCRRGVCRVCSALHAAAQRGPLKLMQLLLAHKAEVGLADAKGWTPLHLAARAGAAAKVECLLAAGAKVSDVNNQGNTPLHLVSHCV